MYKFLRNILFLFSPEWVHYFSMNCLKFLCSIGFLKKIIAKIFKPEGNNEFSIFNLQFPNRVGLGAGFDKNAKYLKELEILGFGFVEIGTVTPLPQKGNPKPRLFRLPKDKALINRMGFNNDGAKAIAKRLKKFKIQNSKSKIIIGGNIGKNKITPNEEAWKDYEICFKEMHSYVDYFVVNVSSPNTPGLRKLQEKESLRKILSLLQNENSKFKIQRPILLKIAPDLTNEQLDDVIDLAIEIKLDGLVASNTTIARDNLSENSKLKSRKIGNGGLSGLPLKQRSTEIVKYIHQKTNGQLPIIASGGIFNAKDAEEKITAGASLVQVWTGFIYEGPGIVKNIYKKLISA
ncbi:MAG TPA: quinone-dependent dihydroorotate dehydrogenase [Chitinophagaceae bacterium]|nr:quinone-dependent dihydroorotate dehydrogenase [Chitinophagaceae bacterium]